MTFSQKRLYCGSPGIGLGWIFDKGRLNGPDAWFADKKTCYTYKARVAIQQACVLLGIGDGDEVLAPAYNCGSEISPLLNSGASVTLYRIDKRAQIDLADVRKRLSEKTKAIYVTHYFGFAQPIDEIKNICDKNGLYLIEDCALSLFSCVGGNKLGSIGDISIFNFPKTLPLPDGGVIVINNPDLAADNWNMRKPRLSRVLRYMLPRLKRYVQHLLSGSRIFLFLLWLLKKTLTPRVNEIGNQTNYPEIPSDYYYDESLNHRKMSKISERILRTFDVTEVISRRRNNFRKYLNLLSGVKGVETLYKELPEGVCPLYFPIIVNKRSHVCMELNVLSIGAIAWWAGYHRSLPWAEYPDACFLKDNLLVLPVHQQLNDRHIEFITQTLLGFVDKVRA